MASAAAPGDAEGAAEGSSAPAAGTQGEPCSICLEPVRQAGAAMYCDGAAGVRHQFHGQCLGEWVQACVESSRAPSCPNCRAPVAVHRQRLASQIGTAAPVQEFLTQHATQGLGEDEEAPRGWVPVGGRRGRGTRIDQMRELFDQLDQALLRRRALAGGGAPTDAGVSHGGIADDPIESADGPAEPEWASQWESRVPVDVDSAACRSEHQFGPVTVMFPFEHAFQPQQEVMQGVVRAVLQSRHIVIESPTGTGKTVSLLCAVLAAQRHLCERHGRAPRIVYCTRTHTQIKQVVREARRCPYRPWLQVVGSREQGLCSEPSVLSQARLLERKSSQVCKLARGRADRPEEHDSQSDVSACRVWPTAGDAGAVERAHGAMRAGGGSDAQPVGSHGMLDIEDLAALGRDLGTCPFFLSRAALPAAELVVCPYNYVLDPEVGKRLGILDGKSIVVIDEGHNLEAQCCDAGTVSMLRGTLMDINMQVEETRQYFHNPAAADMVSDTIRAIVDFCSLKMNEKLREIRRDPSAPVQEDRLSCATWSTTVETGPNVADFLSACRVPEELLSTIGTLEEVVEAQASSGGRMVGLSIHVGQALGNLRRLAEALDSCRRRPSQFKIHLELLAPDQATPGTPRRRSRGSGAGELSPRGSPGWPAGGSPAQQQGGGGPEPAAPRQGGRGAQGATGWTFELSVVMVTPEAVMEPLVEAAHCVIIASGTLAPAAWFTAELGAAFAGRALEGPPVQAGHIIQPSQLGLVFVGRASSGRELRCVRESMTHRAFAQALGQTLVELISAIPGGVLVFLPSRAMLDAVNRFWSDAPAGAGRSVWQALQDSKGHLVIEGSGADARRALDDHQRAVERDGSCVFFGVYRGRASEGISLSDDSVRGVVCVGIPLAPLRPEVRLRRDYRNALAQAAPAPGAPRGPAQARLSGDDWYQLQAHRAVNQALGRVIRHRDDYGVCALVDWRWTARGSLRAVRYLPLWLRQLVGIHDGVRGENADFALEHVVRQVRGHFANHLHRSSQGYAAGADAPGVLSGEDASRQVRPRRH